MPKIITRFLRWIFRADKVESEIKRKQLIELEDRKKRMFKFVQKR